MKQVKRYCILGAAVVAISVLSGCSSTEMNGAKNSVDHVFSNSEVVRTTSVRYKPTNPKQVALYFDSSKPSHRYKVIGRVNSDTYNIVAFPISEKSIMHAFKVRAASIGGNAVINIKRSLNIETGDVVRFVS